MIGLVLVDPALLDLAPELNGSLFSVRFLGKAYDALSALHRQGLQVSLAALQDLTPEESARLSAVSQRFDRVRDERAFTDCVAVILSEREKKRTTNTDEDLLQFAKELSKNKGYGEN